MASVDRRARNTWKCGLPRSCTRHPLASSSSAYFLPASHLFLKGKDVSMGTSRMRSKSLASTARKPAVTDFDQTNFDQL